MKLVVTDVTRYEHYVVRTRGQNTTKMILEVVLENGEKEEIILECKSPGVLMFNDHLWERQNSIRGQK